MREIIFIRKHEVRWLAIEQHLKKPRTTDPDILASDYVSVIDDLAYARAKYPKSQTTHYLNQLAALAHNTLANNRRAHLRSAGKYWTHTVPVAFVGMRIEMLVCTIALILTSALGFLAGYESDAFARTILGNGYVDMTLQNIESGNPMGVYSSMDSFSMFVRIASNNVYVMLRIISLGLLPIIGVIGSIVYHGLMIGSFHALFAQHHVLGESLLAVWVHGAFELSCLVISAAAGLHAGMSYVNPGTYPRQTAFILAVRRSVTVSIGLLPFIVIAAVLESFVTRFTDMPLALNLFIIASSFALIWSYVVVLPSYLINKRSEHVRVSRSAT